LVVGGALALLTLAPLNWLPPDWMLLLLAVPLISLALLLPRILWLPNLLWMKLGVFLGSIVQFVSLGVLFFGALTFIGGTMKLFGVDRLKNQMEPDLGSYWEDYRQDDDAPADMRRQS